MVPTYTTVFAGVTGGSTSVVSACQEGCAGSPRGEGGWITKCGTNFHDGLCGVTGGSPSVAPCYMRAVRGRREADKLGTHLQVSCEEALKGQQLIHAQLIAQEQNVLNVVGPQRHMPRWDRGLPSNHLFAGVR